VTPEIASKKEATIHTHTHTHCPPLSLPLSLSLSLTNISAKELLQQEASKVTEHKKAAKSMREKPVAFNVDSFVFKMFH
jgi:hypothetical protein